MKNYGWYMVRVTMTTPFCPLFLSVKTEIPSLGSSLRLSRVYFVLLHTLFMTQSYNFPRSSRRLLPGSEQPSSILSPLPPVLLLLLYYLITDHE